MKTKYAMYRGIKVKLTGKKSKWYGVKFIQIKFSNGTVYDCLAHELTEIGEDNIKEEEA